MKNLKRDISDGSGDVDSTKRKIKKVQFMDVKDETKNSMSKDKKKHNGKVRDVENKTIKKNVKAPKSISKFTPSKNRMNKLELSKQKTDEKPKWSEMKKEKKKLRIVRRKAKATVEVFEISHKAKLLAAQIQRKVMKPEFRLAACKELHVLLKGQYTSIALTHDLSRVIQVLLKYSPETVKNEIAEEVLQIIVKMAQSKYAQHSVKRILKYGTDFIRHDVIKKFLGHIVQLATHSISAPVLDYAYGEFATKKEKLYMQQEFYGDMYKNSKDDKVKSLKDAYENSPEMKAAILHSCKANIQRVLDKNLHDSELFQTVLYDYIRECSPVEKAELITTLSPLIVPISNSLPGVNAASICVWQGTNKDKKTIIKVVKEHVLPLSKHKTGHRLLLSIFDSVDDTVLVKKAIVATLVSNFKEIVQNHWGNMTLHWLVKPKDPSVFHPSLKKFLDDGIKSGSSKKDPDLRVSELRESIMPALKKDIESDPEFWLCEKSNLLLAVSVLSIESTSAMLKSLATVICKPDWKIQCNGKEIMAIEDAGVHMCLKKLVCLDKDKSEDTLGEAISEQLDDEVLILWLRTNRGCFFLLKLIEANEEKVANSLKEKIKQHTNILKESKSEGAKLLLQNI